MNIMILAAGQGTRLRPYTEVLPKPAIPFLNVPLAAYSLNLIKDIEYDNVVVNTFHLPDKVHNLFKSIPRKNGSDLKFSDETDFIKGSAGGLKQAEALLNLDDVMLLNSDEVIIPKNLDSVSSFAKYHDQSNSFCTLLVMDHPEVGTKFGGVWVDQDNNVLGFGKTALPNSVKAFHFVGVQILDHAILNYIQPNVESNILYDAVSQAISEGKTVKAFPIECSWYETGNPKDFFHAQEQCLQDIIAKSPNGNYLESFLQEYSDNGITFVKSKEAIMAIHKDANIHPEIILRGVVCIGSNATIEKNSTLEDTVINKDCIVLSGSNIKATMILE